MIRNAEPEWDLGSVIGGRYRIAGVLGRGGMGIVYAAEDLKLQGKLRAIKAPGAYYSDKTSFADEAQMLMKLNHPNLPSIVDYSPPDGSGPVWFAMDYIPGNTLQSLVKRQDKPFSLTAAVRIALQLCSALSYMHSQSPPVIHRDLKPSNVMVDDKGFVRLIDFGIARAFRPGSRQEDTVLLGTPGFAAPEQQGGFQSGIWTDMFGLGALLYFMLTNGMKFEPAGRERNPWKAIPASVPRTFHRVLERMLDDHPSRRFDSMETASAALREFMPKAETAALVDAAVLRGNRAVTVTVLSLSPGAGGSFIAITLAKLLAKRRHKVTAAEHPAVRPEWHALFGGGAAGLYKQRFENKRFGDADSRFISWSGRDGVNWHMLKPETNAFDPLPHAAGSRENFELMLANGEADIKLVDLSSCWELKGLPQQLQLTDILIVVADPNLQKWQADRVGLLEKLTQERTRKGQPTLWVANKDVSFDGRQEWLSMLSSAQLCRFPQLSPADVYNAVWREKWITDDPSMLRIAEKALKPVAETVAGLLQTKFA